MDSVDEATIEIERMEQQQRELARQATIHDYVILIREDDGTASEHKLKGTTEDRLRFMGPVLKKGRYAFGYISARGKTIVDGNDDELTREVKMRLRD